MAGPDSRPREDATSDPESAVEAAIADAGVGSDDLHADLGDVDGLGDVAVRDGHVRVVVTLPVPSEAVRSRLAAGIESAAGSVDGVRSVEVAFRPAVPDPGERVDLLPDVKHVVAVASGKGGVGKSTVATNLAVALADAGLRVGLLDADVYGPNAPTMLGLDDRSPNATGDDLMVPREAHGVRVMSMGFVAGEDDPVIWRGPLVDDFVQQLAGDVGWGELDYLVVDLPPGTGDAHLALVQRLPLSGTVVVTTPQEVALDDAARGLVGFARYDVPILGIVENMAGFRCPDCGSVHHVFDEGGGDRLAAEFEIPVLGRIPLDPAVGTLEDDGDPDRPPGVDVPLLGRFQLPRTREERQRDGTLPPVALRDDGGPAREGFRVAATAIAARLNEASRRLDD